MMLNSPLVSIIVPNYNNAKYLTDCIESIQNQSYKNIEIIIVDDCSTDNSMSILTELSNKYNNIIIYKNEKNRGVSYSRNLGIIKSSGDFFSTLDPDDQYYSDKIELEVKKIISKPNEDIIVYSGFNSVNENLEPIPFKAKLTNFNAVNGWIYKKLCYMVIPVPRDMLMKKDQFISVGGFNESMSLYEDWDFKLRLAKKYKFLFSGSKGVKYRRHSSGLSSVDFNKHLEIMLRIFNKYTENPNISLFTLINSKGNLSKIVKSICYLPFVNYFFK